MIEIIDNILQLAVLLGCWLYTVYQQLRTRSKVWTPLLLCYICIVLVDVYWLLFLMLKGASPQHSSFTDYGYYAAVLFLCILLQTDPPPAPTGKDRLLPWLGPLFCGAAFLFFIQWQEYFSNLLALLVMGYLGCWSLRVLQQKGPKRLFAAACLLHLCLEYSKWISSCFWAGDSLGNSYFWFDFLQTLNYIWLVVSYRRAVAE